MHPAVEYALKVHRAINKSEPRQRWGSLEIIFTSEVSEPIVRMDIGKYSLFDGRKQQRLLTRTFHYDGSIVFWSDKVHS